MGLLLNLALSTAIVAFPLFFIARRYGGGWAFAGLAAAVPAWIWLQADWRCDPKLGCDTGDGIMALFWGTVALAWLLAAAIAALLFKFVSARSK